MDFQMDSPDVEREFPGLYASEEPHGTKSKKDDSSDGEHEKISKKDLLRRKEKKEKKCYAALGDEDDEAPTLESSKSKKLKAFKFSSSRSKEKRDKSQDKQKSDKDSSKGTLEKKKDKKDKDKKEKDKKKDDKKLKLKDGSEDVPDLGEAQPIFGVSLSIAVERSRCHDDVELPLVVRDCIDFLQENLAYEHIYRSDGSKSRLQQLKRSYNNRETTGTMEFDVPIACSLLKLFLKELPEPILTTDLLPRFEEAAALPTSTEQEKGLKIIIDDQLPQCNKILLSWIFLHLDAVTQNEKSNKLNAQNLAVILSPVLQMSHRLFITLLCYCSDLFPGIQLTKYVPPITSSSPNLPESKDDIAKELKKQESLLNQIHAEMHAGFVTKKREEQLWEVQRIITQLKRKLRSFDKKNDTMQKSVEDSLEPATDAATVAPQQTSPTPPPQVPPQTDPSALQKAKSYSDDENSSIRTITIESNTNTETKPSPQDTPNGADKFERVDVDGTPTNNNESNILTIDENGLVTLPTTHPDYLTLLRYQLENQELINWKNELQTKITSERSEVVRLKNLLAEIPVSPISDSILITDEAELEKLAAYYLKENALLEQKKEKLSRDLFFEHHSLIQMQVELELQKYKQGQLTQ